MFLSRKYLRARLAVYELAIDRILNRAVRDTLSGQIAAAVALYHVGPVIRATSRIWRGNPGHVLGGAWLYFTVHLLCAVRCARLA